MSTTPPTDGEVKPIGSGWPGVTPELAEALTPKRLSTTEAAELAARWKLHPVGERPPLTRYLSQVLERRHFLWALSTAKLSAQTSEDRLGGLWQVLNPILSAGVYYFAFGVILQARSAVPNYTLFLVIGVFVFTMMSRQITIGAMAVASNRGLIQALRFPRVILPLSVGLRETLAFLPSVGIMLAAALVTGERPEWSWFELVPVLLLTAVFATGTGMVTARLVANHRDVAQVLPFAVRLWMYVSGVFMSLDAYFDKNPGLIADIAHANPGYAYLELARGALMNDYGTPPWAWYSASAWAFGMALVGFAYFWHGEESYGRE